MILLNIFRNGLRWFKGSDGFLFFCLVVSFLLTVFCAGVGLAVGINGIIDHSWFGLFGLLGIPLAIFFIGVTRSVDFYLWNKFWPWEAVSWDKKE